MIRVSDEARNAIETRDGSLSKARIAEKISEDRYWFRRWAMLTEATPAPRALDHSHTVEKDREILVLFDVLSLGSRSRSKNHSGGS